MSSGIVETPEHEGRVHPDKYRPLPVQTYAHNMKQCRKCDQMVEPAGGVDMGSSRWICNRCWLSRRHVQKNKVQKL